MKLRTTRTSALNHAKKLLLYALTIIVYAIIIFLLRVNFELPNWVYWVLSFLFIATLSAIRGSGNQDNQSENDDEEQQQN